MSPTAVTADADDATDSACGTACRDVAHRCQRTLCDALFGLTRTTCTRECVAAATAAAAPPSRCADADMSLLTPSEQSFLFAHDTQQQEDANECEADDGTATTMTTRALQQRRHQHEAQHDTLSVTLPCYIDVIGRAKLLRVMFARFVRTPLLWWDDVGELLELAAAAAAGADADDATRSPSPLPRLSMVTSHLARDAESVVWYSDGMRAKLMRLLQARTDAPAATAACAVAGDNDGATSAQPASSSVTATTQRHDDNGTCGSVSPDVFAGPCAVWDAYVLTHRQDAHLPSPQRPPYSFSELVPTITLRDCERRRYRDAVPYTTAMQLCGQGGGDVAATATTTTALATAAAAAATAPSMTVEQWAQMDEHARNVYLFGCVGADYAQRVREERGVYAAYHVTDDTPDKDTTAAAATDSDDKDDNSNNNSDDEHIRVSDCDEQEAGDGDVDGSGGAVCVGDEACDAELQRLCEYDVDMFYMSIIEPSAAHCLHASTRSCNDDDNNNNDNNDNSIRADAVERDLLYVARQGITARSRLRAAKKRASLPLRDVWLPHGRVCSAASGEVEDVQLQRLWHSFRRAPVAVLLDNYAHVHARLSALQDDVRGELAEQCALRLLFFSRAEVRALTHPADTYERVWRLHKELLTIMRAATAAAATTTSMSAHAQLAVDNTAAAYTRQEEHVPYATLNAQAQQTYVGIPPAMLTADEEAGSNSDDDAISAMARQAAAALLADSDGRAAAAHSDGETTTTAAADDAADDASLLQPRKRGRPRKHPVATTTAAAADDDNADDASAVHTAIE